MSISIHDRGFGLMKHRAWEDGASMILGVLIVLSPWLTEVVPGPAVMTATGLAGVIIFALAWLEVMSLRRWEELIEALCGAWLIASPYVFGYGGALRYWHFALGALVVLLAALELWQDRDRKLEG